MEERSYKVVLRTKRFFLHLRPSEPRSTTSKVLQLVTKTSGSGNREGLHVTKDMLNILAASLNEYDKNRILIR
jgi:hypothetical protein